MRSLSYWRFQDDCIATMLPSKQCALVTSSERLDIALECSEICYQLEKTKSSYAITEIIDTLEI